MNKYTKSCTGCIYFSSPKRGGGNKSVCILGQMKLNCKDRKENKSNLGRGGETWNLS